MEQEQAIRSGVTASVVVHLSVLAMILISTEVHPHRSAAEPIAVDIVAPSEIAKAEPETEPEKKQLHAAGPLGAQPKGAGTAATAVG